MFRGRLRIDRVYGPGSSGHRRHSDGDDQSRHSATRESGAAVRAAASLTFLRRLELHITAGGAMRRNY